MQKFVNFVLTILVFVAFLFGVRIGKIIQKIDTPVRTEYKQKKVLVYPTLKLTRISLENCGFDFVIPDNFSYKASSTSAIVYNNDNKLSIDCSNKPKNIIIKGDKNLLQQLGSGFNPEFTYTK